MRAMQAVYVSEHSPTAARRRAFGVWCACSQSGTRSSVGSSRSRSLASSASARLRDSVCACALCPFAVVTNGYSLYPVTNTSDGLLHAHVSARDGPLPVPRSPLRTPWEVAASSTLSLETMDSILRYGHLLSECTVHRVLNESPLLYFRTLLIVCQRDRRGLPTPHEIVVPEV